MENSFRKEFYEKLFKRRFASSFLPILINKEFILTDEVPYFGINNRCIFINPKTYYTLTDSEFDYIIAHEVAHIALNHFSRFPEMTELANIACDLAINSLLGYPPPRNGIHPRLYNLPEGLTAEEYYDLLIQKSNEQQQKQGQSQKQKQGQGQGQRQEQGEGQGQEQEEGQGQEQEEGQGQGQGQGQKQGKGSSLDKLINDAKKNALDNHDLTTNKDKITDTIENGKLDNKDNVDIRKDSLINRIKNGNPIKESENEFTQKIKKNYDKIMRGFGSSSGDIEKLIDLVMSEKHQILYKTILSFFVSSLLKNKKRTWAKLELRRSFIQKGSLRERMVNIIVIIDTSLSMDMENIKKFISYLAHMNNVKMDIITCDTQANLNKISKMSDFNNITFSAGGTDLNPAFEYDGIGKYDGIVCLTDGDMPDIKKPIKLKTLWVLPIENYTLEHIPKNHFYIIIDFDDNSKSKFGRI
ncbi:MAG: M48 family metalloprotease [Bacteroidales bacterium]|nr:M48 family metalloprotease [Bacteroidales bacterium]